jgi:hypothetical protein
LEDLLLEAWRGYSLLISLKGKTMVRIIEVTESTTDPVVLESRWLETTSMLSEQGDEPYADDTEAFGGRSRLHGQHDVVREDFADRCLVGC